MSIHHERPTNLRTTEDSNRYPLQADRDLDYDITHMCESDLEWFILQAILLVNDEKYDDAFLPSPFWFIFIDVIAQLNPGKLFGNKFRFLDQIRQQDPGTEGFKQYADEYYDLEYVDRFAKIAIKIMNECLSFEGEQLPPDLIQKAVFLKEAANRWTWDNETKGRYPELYTKYEELERRPLFAEILKSK